MTTSDTTSDHFGFFFFFLIREEPILKYPKENSLNIEEELWWRPIELKILQYSQENICVIVSF